MTLTKQCKIEVQCFYCEQKLYKWPSQIKNKIKCGKSCPKAKEIRKCIRCNEKFEVYISEKKKNLFKKNVQDLENRVFVNLVE